MFGRQHLQLQLECMGLELRATDKVKSIKTFCLIC